LGEPAPDYIPAMADPARASDGAAGDGPPSRLALPDDWPAQAADTVVRVVGNVRDRTTGPAITVARAVVYGLLAAIVGVVALVLVVAALVRFVDVWVPGEVWSAHLIVGAVLCVAGLLLWRKRRAPTAV
jgi:hypothetical protein